MTPYYDDSGRLHDSVVVYLARLLKKRHPDHEIVPNVKYRRKRQGPLLRNGLAYYPDIADYSSKIAYEVHWKGSRKEASYDGLPEGWRGVDVFITDSSNPFCVVVKMPGFETTFVCESEKSDAPA